MQLQGRDRVAVAQHGEGATATLKHVIAALAPLALLALSAAGAAAQIVRGTVVNDGNAPVPGVIVLLLDSASAVVAQSLTGERGEFRLNASRAGTYRTRTLRIGFRPTISEPFRLAASQELVQRLVLASVQFVLDTVNVRGRNECRIASEPAASTYAVWEQVQAALTATQITSARTGAVATTITYERTLDPTGRRILEQATRMNSRASRRIWRARSADSLHAFGYVTREADGSSNYYAPDLETMLSPGFLEDHCFRLVSGRNRAQLGIAFEPAPSRKRLPEITGTLWLDRVSSGLQRLEFRYVNVSVDEDGEARGELDFIPARNGAWAIQRWSIRMPQLARTVRPGALGGAAIVVSSIKVAGGELAMLRDGADTLWAQAPLQLSGVVRDSVSRVPVGGARVTLAGTTLEARTNVEGSFTIAGVLPGEYTLETHTPSLDSLNAVQQTPVVFTPSADRVEVRIASSATLLAALCRGQQPSEPGIVLGRIVSVRDTMPFHTLRVRAEWAEYVVREGVSADAIERPTRFIETRADGNGAFRICGVPVGADIMLRAESDSAERVALGGRSRFASPAQVNIPRSVRLARAELRVEPPRVVGSVFAGVVLGDSTRSPVVGAEVILPELSRTAITNESGAFRIADVPPGTHKVMVRRVGYGMMASPIEFPENRTVDRRFLLDRITMIDTVITEANIVNESFEANRKIGIGHFVTRAELEKINAKNLTDVLTTIPGLGVRRGTAGHAWPMSSRMVMPGVTRIYYPQSLIEQNQGLTPGCYAHVYVDQMLMNPGSPTPAFDVNQILPSSVEGIEYYATPSIVPSRYSLSNSACGVIVIWTRQFRGKK